MDFKVAGTHKGITAIQMDIKIHGLTRPIIEEAIAKTRKARLYIIDEVMNKAIDAPRAQVGEFAPKIVQMQIDPQKIGDVVGQRGKTINAIIDETGVKIDITDDGAVSICGTDAKSMEEAQKLIHIIVVSIKVLLNVGVILEGVLLMKEDVKSSTLVNAKRSKTCIKGRLPVPEEDCKPGKNNADFISGKKEYEKAQELIDTLPDASFVDKNTSADQYLDFQKKYRCRGGLRNSK